MAFNDQEIELKFPLTSKKYAEIRGKVKSLAKFSGSSHQVDRYYSPRVKSFLAPKYPYEWLSLRERGRKVSLNYKHWYPEGARNTTHCDEYEIEVENSQKMAKILKALKFSSIITVDKKRETYIYLNKLEIALDDVADLGFFIEIEAVKDFGGVVQGRQEILKFVRKLDLYEAMTVPGGYALALLKKKRQVKR